MPASVLSFCGSESISTGQPFVHPMDPLIALGIFIAAIVAGLVGALFGIGGGIVIIPVLTIAFGLDIKEAIGASLIGVIASSTGAASRYLSSGLVNIRLGMVMEPFTAAGSIVGAIIAVYLDQAALAAAFGAILVYSAYPMLRKTEAAIPAQDCCYSGLSGRYVDQRTGEEVCYEVRHLRRGLGASFLAGNMAGLLGLGGGLVKVPAMNLWMGVPLRAATATSNFMIGVTALAGAAVFYANGLISPVLAATVAVGVFAGATLGTRVSGRIAVASLRKYFAALLLIVSLLMFLRAAGISVGV